MMFEGIYDMFIYNWWEVNETGDLTWLYIDRAAFIAKGKKLKGKEEAKLKQRLKKISDQFFDEIALNSDMEEYILKLYKLQEIRAKLILTKDRALETQYLILEKQIESRNNEFGNVDNYDKLAILGKYQGWPINAKTTTIKEFDSYEKNFIKEQDAIRRQAAGK